VRDRVTETPYPTPLETFETGLQPEPTRTVPVLEEGRPALEAVGAPTPGGLRFTLQAWSTLHALPFFSIVLCDREQLTGGPGFPVLVSLGCTRPLQPGVRRLGPGVLHASAASPPPWSASTRASPTASFLRRQGGNRRGGTGRHTLQGGQGQAPQGTHRATVKGLRGGGSDWAD
jgi:hypothetical protein